MEYAGLERIDDALATFEKLRELNAKYVPMYLMCGQLLVKAGRAAEARTWLDRRRRGAREGQPTPSARSRKRSPGSADQRQPQTKGTPEQTPLTQSVGTRHVWPVLQCWQSRPPQSVSVSFPFCTPSPQVAMRQAAA